MGTTVALGTLPVGSKGFDCNATVTLAQARRFVAHGYTFAIRYLRRDARHAFDLTPSELVALLTAGLGVMAVQHVALPGWVPTQALGDRYGDIAGEEAGRAGLMYGTTVWCDLEGVARGVLHQQTIDYCNAWCAAVRSAGYDPGLYVGDSPGLSSSELYHRLRFRRYWAAYNLNRDQIPAVRGVQLRQHAATATDYPVDIPYEIDVNLIGRDRLGDTPILILPKRSRLAVPADHGDPGAPDTPPAA